MDTDAAIKKVEELTDMAFAGNTEQVAKILGEPLRIESFSRAGIMKGVAAQVLPERWDWEVVELVGSDCQLIITWIHDA